MPVTASAKAAGNDAARPFEQHTDALRLAITRFQRDMVLRAAALEADGCTSKHGRHAVISGPARSGKARAVLGLMVAQKMWAQVRACVRP